AFAVIQRFGPTSFPRSIYILDLVICFIATAGVRMLIRVMRETWQQGSPAVGAYRTLIYGAGQAGFLLHREIRSNSRLPFIACGFIDDDPKKRGLIIQGTKVLGNGNSLKHLVRKYRIDTVLISMPSASGGQMTQILRHCLDAGVRYKTVPSLG